MLSLVGHSWVKLSPTQNLPTWYLVWSVVRIGLNQLHTRWTMQVSTPVCWSGDYPLTGSPDVLWSDIRRICGTYWSVKAVRDSISTFTVQNIKQPVVQQPRFEFRTAREKAEGWTSGRIDSSWRCCPCLPDSMDHYYYPSITAVRCQWVSKIATVHLIICLKSLPEQKLCWEI